MPELLRMPAIAADTEEATLASWAVPENQGYRASDVIATIETAKAAVDVEADSDGVILKTLVAPGTDVRVGDAIALIGAPGESVDDADAALAALGVGAPPVPPELDRPDSSTEPEASAAVSPAGPAGAGSAQPAGTAAGPAGQGGQPPASGERVFASPLARRLARDAGLGLERLSGSGPNGRITRRDVEQALAAGTGPGPAQEQAPPAPLQTPASAAPAQPAQGTATQETPASSPQRFGPAGFTDIPHSRLRIAIARRLTQSKATIPHFYLRGSAQVDRLLALRAELNQGAAARISVNDLIVKAVGCAHQAVPAVNVIWTPAGLRQFSAVDLGIAVTTPAGLVTPVVRSVDQLSISGVAAAASELAGRARAGGLKQAEIEGGTATITNLGMFGTEEFAAIINPPQSAILAVGAARSEPALTAKGKVRAAAVLHVTLSVDHRAIDGALAAEWMSVFTEILQNPLRILR